MAILWLLIAHLAGQFSSRVLGHDNLFGLVPMFHLDGEHNVPTVFSSGLLLACAMLLSVSARRARQWRWFWYLLSVVFCVLAVDELVQIHEPLVFVLKGNVSPATVDLARRMPLRLANMKPQLAAAGVVVSTTTFLFLRSLPRRSAWLFAIAGTVYVCGAVGFDQLTAKGADYVTSGLWRAVFAIVEELLEMCGAALFLYALLDRLAREPAA